MSSDFHRTILGLLDVHFGGRGGLAIATTDAVPVVLDPVPATTEAVLQDAEPAAETRHTEPAKRGRARGRASMRAKDLAPETKDPSPE